MSMLADQVDVVIGVDTHKSTHTAVVVMAKTGVAVAEATVDTNPAGYLVLLDLATTFQGLRAWAIEGTGGYGPDLPASSLRPANEWSSWTVPNGLADAAAQSLIPSTLPERPAMPWPVNTWANLELEVSRLR